MQAQSDGLSLLSSIIGWIYFLAWSISFYPQIITNYRRQAVDGVAFEFIAYNLTGFLFYLIFLVATYIIQSKCRPRSVEPNDIAFAAHSLLLTVVIVIQCMIYPRKGQTFSKFHLVIIGIIWITTLVSVICSFIGVISWFNPAKSAQLNFIEFLGTCKLLISFIKYVPQAYLNYKRQSTVGWPIENVLLDLTGGIGSFLQQFIDAYNYNDYTIFTGNLPKLLLAIESVCFDIIFSFQHFVLYRENKVNNKLLSEVSNEAEESGLTAENTTSENEACQVPSRSPSSTPTSRLL